MGRLNKEKKIKLSKRKKRHLNEKFHMKFKKKLNMKKLMNVKNFTTIRFKLIISFMVPIAFIIALGVISYQKSATSIIESYENATVQSVDMAGKYMRFGIEAVEATAVQYMGDDTISKYFLNMYKDDDMEYNNKQRTISTLIKAKKGTDEFIENIYFVSDQVDSITTKTKRYSDVYNGFVKTELGQYLNSNRTKHSWIGQDEYLDQALAAPATDYSLRLVRNFTSANGLLVIDVSADVVKAILEDLQYDEAQIVGVVTKDGKEVLLEDSENKYFYDQTFYTDAIASGKDSGLSYIDYNKQSYLFIYSNIGETGAMVCALIPKAAITKQADSIKQVTVIVTIIACLAAVAIGMFMSIGIDKTIKGIIISLKKAAQGDLTVKFNYKKKDEFSILITEIQNTFSNMKGLIQQVKDLSGGVSSSSEDVSKTSEQFLQSTREISTAVSEIEQGINQQARDAEECLVQMDELSKKIILVNNNAKEITQIADNAKTSIKEGTVVTQNLNQQTKSTTAITTNIIEEIEKLADKSMTIDKIINVINEIANQTNLLSLNASIEAARAGEYGKGFAVVASEIRKLAEQSQNSVNDIKTIIGSIQEDTIGVVKIAKSAEEVLQQQENAVKETTDSYQDINDNVENLMVHLQYIRESVDNIEEARMSTLGAIESISAVLEEIAASSNTVSQTSDLQLATVDELNSSASNLHGDAEHLVDAVSAFRVE